MTNKVNALLTTLESGYSVTLDDGGLITLKGDPKTQYIEILVEGQPNGLWDLSEKGVIDALKDAVKILEVDYNDLAGVKAIEASMNDVENDVSGAMDLAKLQALMEGHLEAITGLADTHMVERGLTSDDCQKVALVNSVKEVENAVNGIDAYDLKREFNNDAGIFYSAMEDVNEGLSSMQDNIKSGVADLVNYMQKNGITQIEVMGTGGGDSGDFDHVLFFDQNAEPLDFGNEGLDADLYDALSTLTCEYDWYNNSGGKVHLAAKLENNALWLDRDWEKFILSPCELEEDQIVNATKEFSSLINKLPSDVVAGLKNNLQSLGGAALQFKKEFSYEEVHESQSNIEGDDNLKELIESSIYALDEGAIEKCMDAEGEGLDGMAVFNVKLDNAGELAASYNEQSTATYYEENLENLADSQNVVALDDPDLVALLEALNKAPASNELGL